VDLHRKGREKECRRLKNEQFYDLCSSPNIILMIKSRRISCMGHVTCIWGEERIIENFGRKAEEKKQVGGPRCKWEINIKIKL